MTVTDLILILVSGVTAGFLNAVSGGGAMLTIPALILIGLPSGVANGTNRLAVVIQSLTALAAYKKLHMADNRLAFSLLIPAMLGSVCGAMVSVRLDDAVFQTLLAVMMLVMLIPLLFKSTLQTRLLLQQSPDRNRRILKGIFFGIGLYGGLLQIGAGIFVLVTLGSLAGINLVLANGVKVVIVLGLTSIALVVFIFDGKVDWGVGLLLSIATSIGSWFGAHWGVRKGEAWIRLVVTGTVVAMALQLLGAWEFVRGLIA